MGRKIELRLSGALELYCHMCSHIRCNFDITEFRCDLFRKDLKVDSDNQCVHRCPECMSMDVGECR